MVDSIAAMTNSTPIYESLAISVRRLIDATIRTELGHDVIAAATAKIDSVTSELSAAMIPGSFGCVEHTVEFSGVHRRPHRRNPSLWTNSGLWTTPIRQQARSRAANPVG
jgi:hypothetical protein